MGSRTILSMAQQGASATDGLAYTAMRSAVKNELTKSFRCAPVRGNSFVVALW